MRLLLANPNTTRSITELMAQAARSVASAGTSVKAVTADFGAAVIGSRMEMVIGDYASLSLIAREAEGCDAVIVAAALDSGLRALKEMLPVPVLGLTQAAVHAACLTGGRFGLVVSTARVATVMEEMIEGYGLASRLAGVSWVGADPTAIYGDPGGSAARIAECARSLVTQKRADAVVLIGAVMAGIPERIRDDVPVPLIEGVTAATVLAEGMVRLGTRKATAGSFAAPAPRIVSGITVELEARLRRESSSP
ncbi:aspartate/glutamate racemase family protein [Roseomonas rosulenta]|uniref:aspartate/glutamate racemase family protein n=1 Tax=Roseomonas rosulenta TaxID=2748667 RepID=UPI0018DF7358|nr:aspartate/glutamate racemase family protein [Roseomonas rosulenta]